MKFKRRKRSTTFKTHFFSALCRSLFTNTSLIVVNSIFVKSVGGKSYSQLFFYASLASVVYYIYFALRGDKEAFGVYKAVIGLALLASVLCFFEPHAGILQPYNIALLYFFAVSVIVVDLIGTTIGPVILQLSVNPAIFREVYQKIVTCELIARMTAAAVVWFLSSKHWLEACYPLGWLTVGIHFVLFNVTLFRLRLVERKARKTSAERDVSKALRRSLRFMFSNSLVRTAMTIMIWTHVTKFLVEYLFYQAADANFSSARQVASFVSATTMTMIVLSLAAQHFFGRKVTERRQLSTLFAVQPINILLVGSMALLFPPFWPLVILMVTYTMINRSIQLPVSRQCLIPIPRGERSTIVSLICILMSSSTMIVGGTMAVLKSSMHLQDFLVVLVVLAAAIFFLITRLDSFYIRNLWSFYREARSGSWQDGNAPESLISVELAPAAPIDDPTTFHPTSDLKSHVVLEAYATSFDRDQLSCATQDHKELIESGQNDLVILGLQICFVSGFPWFEAVLRRFAESKSKDVSDFARLALKVNDEYRNLGGYSSVFGRRIKALTLELLQSGREEDAARLRALAAISDRGAAESLVAALSEVRLSDVQAALLRCIDPAQGRLTLQPLFDRMYECDYDSGEQYRLALQMLSFGKESPEVLQAVEANLALLNHAKLALHSPEADRDGAQMQKFMHTLFAEEYRLSPREIDRSLTGTIGEFESLSAEDTGMLIDMHLEFLKRSALFKKWQLLMS
ncbi:MAG TPA: hypothetical protein V6C72_16950 [Chroococcales cyanobacterium]